MHQFIKYVLVLAVLFFGFHAASRFKASSPEPTTTNVAESETAALSSHPDAQLDGEDAGWQAPAAALSDTVRSEADVVETESLDTFKPPTLRRQTTIEKSSSADAFRVAEGWSKEESFLWDQEPADRESKGRQERNMPEKPKNRKKGSVTKNSRNGKKAQDSDKAYAGVKTDDDKRTNRREESARGDRGIGSNDASPRQANTFSGTPEWPMGERIASSSMTTSTEKVREEGNKWPWEDEPLAVNRTTSPFEHGRADEGENQSGLDDDVEQRAPDKSKARGPGIEKAVKPAKNEQRARTVEKPERHRIVDGDTLPKLALAYLGDRDKYLDIFRANPDVLSDPRLLPIGAEIDIPTSQKHNLERSTQLSVKNSSETEWADDDGEMVPIPTFALPPRISR